MAFKYDLTKRSLVISKETLQLLEEVDAFVYPVLQPSYNTLGELHNTLEVEITDKIANDRTHIVRMSIADIKARIKELEKERETIERENKALLKRKRENPNLNIQLDSQKFFHGGDELGSLEYVLQKNSNKPDDYVVVIECPYHLSGYYTRTGNDAKIVLEHRGLVYRIVFTYIHEMMHAFYDSDRLGTNPNSIEYVEEPLAEYGMLHFMKTFVQAHPEHRDLLDDAINMVNEKQYTLGISHYAFGEYLYQNYSHIEWEKMLLSAKNKVDCNSKEYQSLQKVFTSRPKKNDSGKTAQLIYDILAEANGMPSVKINKQKVNKDDNAKQQAWPPIDEDTYRKWQERYQREGILPSEEELEAALSNVWGQETKQSDDTGSSKVIVRYHEPYDSFGPNYGVYLEYDYGSDDLQYSIKGRGSATKTLSPDQIKTIKAYLRNRQNIEDFFNDAYSTPPNTQFTHVTSHDMSMEYGDRSKSVSNGELMPWAKPFAELCEW